MGIIDSTFGSLLRRKGSPAYSRDQLLEQSLKRERDLKNELAIMQQRVSARSSDLEVKIDLLQFEVSQRMASIYGLQTDIEAIQSDLEIEKANRSAAVHLLRMHGMVEGVPYGSFTREQRAELIAQAIAELSGDDMRDRWLARAPASKTTSAS